jgi:hypothetical protein
MARPDNALTLHANIREATATRDVEGFSLARLAFFAHLANDPQVCGFIATTGGLMDSASALACRSPKSCPQVVDAISRTSRYSSRVRSRGASSGSLTAGNHRKTQHTMDDQLAESF